MNIYSIYKATCRINSKSYIGFDSSYPTRQIQHLKRYIQKSQSTYNSKLYRAIRKYGLENFEWEIIYQSKDGEHTLQVMEPFFIQQYDSFANGYNSTLGGEGCLGYKHTQKHKKYISEIHKCKILSDSTKKKISVSKIGTKQSKETCLKRSNATKGDKNPFYGKKHSEKILQKLRNINFGKQLSETTKMKISKSNKGKIVTKEQKLKQSKNYIVINPNNEKIQIRNLKKFCKENNLTYTNMLGIINGNQKQHKGWICYKV